MNLYISRNGEKSGPYTLEQAQGYLGEGVLLPDDLAWHEGLEGWISLGELTASAPGGPPPIPAQPEPTMTAAPAKAGGNMKLFIGLGAAMAVLAIAAGAWLFLAPKKEQLAGSDPKPNAPSNQNPKAKAPTGKLTEPEAAELLAREIGRWKIAGKNIPVGADAPAPEPFEDILESRWLIEGKSLVSTFAPVDNGHKVQFVGHKNFDAKEGVFTWRSKGDGIPEMIKRERYDRQTKTFRWEFTFPDGAKETGTFQIADTDKRLFKSQVTVDGAVVFRSEATFARIMNDPEPPNPVIAKLTPEEAAEVMALEIGTWESKGQGQPAGGQPNPITMTKEVRWKEEGKSLEYKFSLIENGKPVTYFGHQEYDAAKGVFVYRSKWGNNPETTSHEVYDITTGISRGISVPTPANGEPSTTVLNKRVSDDQLEQTLETSLNGQVLYSHQITSTRINIVPTEPTVAKPEPKDPNLGQIESPEALAKRTLNALSKNDFPALSKLGAESLPKEVLMDTMVNLRYAVTEENIKHTAQRRNITEEEAKEYLKEKIQKEKARMEGGYQEGMKQISAKRKMSFDRVIAEGKKQANIEWDKVSFVRLEGEPFEKNGIKGGDFFIVLAYQGNNFKIKLDDCMHYPKHGWFLMHGPDWGDGTDSVPPDETSEGESSHEEPAQPEPGC